MASDWRKANRVAAERAAAAQRKQAADGARIRDSALDRVASLGAEARMLVSAALDALAERNYEGIQQVSRERKTFFGGYKKEMLGAYPLCVLTVTSHGDPIQRQTMLGADGSIWPWADSIDEFIQQIRDNEGRDRNRFPGPYPYSEPGSIAGLLKVIAGLKDLIDGHPPTGQP